MNYITVAEIAEKWGVSKRRIQKLCEENRIDGAMKFSRIWVIPKDTRKPADARLKKAKDQTDENTNN